MYCTVHCRLARPRPATCHHPPEVNRPSARTDTTRRIVGSLSGRPRRPSTSSRTGAQVPRRPNAGSAPPRGSRHGSRALGRVSHSSLPSSCLLSCSTFRRLQRRHLRGCGANTVRVSGIAKGARPLGKPPRGAGACPCGRSVSVARVRLGQDRLERGGGGAGQWSALRCWPHRRSGRSRCQPFFLLDVTDRSQKSENLHRVNVAGVDWAGVTLKESPEAASRLPQASALLPCAGCVAGCSGWRAASDRYGSLALPAEAAHATRRDMTEAAPAMMPPHAKVVAA
jgi:hypothetical protein